MAPSSELPASASANGVRVPLSRPPSRLRCGSVFTAGRQLHYRPTNSTEGLDAARVIRKEFPQTAILVLSAHVEAEHAMDLLASGQRSGYLLKSHVTDVDDFIETLNRIVRGGSAVDPALVQELISARRVDDPLGVLSRREREVLSLMAQGRSNSGIARQLWVTEDTVEKHVRSILMKLCLPEAEDNHRRVLAVLTYLDSH